MRHIMLVYVDYDGMTASNSYSGLSGITVLISFGALLLKTT